MLNLILIIGFYLLVSGLRPFYCPVELRFCVRPYSDIGVRFRPIFALFSKYQNLQIKIYTQSISKQLNLDFQKYSSQYKNIELKEFKKAHDRFLIIDKKEIYHIGASLKDLGKKWFAFSKFEMEALEVLERLK